MCDLQEVAKTTTRANDGTDSETAQKHDIDPSVYLDRTMTANSFMFRGICPTEVMMK